ncbi:hypothetical protein STEG23_012091, partial [Scotinomys teguina]
CSFVQMTMSFAVQKLFSFMGFVYDLLILVTVLMVFCLKVFPYANRVSLFSLVCPGTHFVDQTGL